MLGGAFLPEFYLSKNQNRANLHGMSSIPLPLTDFQRQIIANVANTESLSWRSKYFDAVESALLGAAIKKLPTRT